MTELINFFPEGYDIRDEQETILNEVDVGFKSSKKFIIINASTGVGKSFIAATLAKYSKEASSKYKDYITSYRAFSFEGKEEALDYPPYNAAVLTVTKNLQDQYLKDFPTAQTFKGKTNYMCDVDDMYDVEDAPCNTFPKQKKECWECNRCPYYEARNRTLINQFGIYNYNVFLNLPEHVKQKQFLICDEASELENVLIDTYSYTTDYENIEKLLGKSFPVLSKEDGVSGYRWLNNLLTEYADRLEELAPIMETPKHKLYKKYRYVVKQIKRHIDTIKSVFENWSIDGSNENSTEYIIELLAPTKWARNVKEGVSFTPYRANVISRHLFDHADKVILMSATLFDYKKDCEDLGIAEDDYTYIEVASNFDPKKSPIKINTKNPLNFNNMEANLPKVMDFASKIFEFHKNEKGLVHTVNFKITEALRSKFTGDRFIYRGLAKTNQQLLSEHMESALPTVMVSPSMSHGVDLKGDLGKFQIIMKIPFLPLSNKRIKRLAREDQVWYTNKTMCSLIQMCGRTTRCDTDESVTYIIDGQIGKLLGNNWNKFPAYFRDRFSIKV